MRKITKELLIIGCVTGAAAVVWKTGLYSVFMKRLPKEDALIRYPYSQLTLKEKQLYASLCEQIEQYKEIAILPWAYTKEEYEKVYLMVAEQEPQFFYLDDIYETSDMMAAVNMFYDVDQENVQAMQKEMEDVADEILKKAEKERTEIQKLTVIHDEIADRCTYKDGVHHSDAYGALVLGEAKCEGYAKAMTYVARRAGMDIMNVTGVDGKGINHVWNIVKIDGEYYNLDLTWDDDEHYNGNSIHACMTMPDEMFRDHKADLSTYTPPECRSVDDSYYQVNGYIVNNADECEEFIENWIGNTELIEFQCADIDTIEAMKEKMKNGSSVREAVRMATGKKKYSAFEDEIRRVIVIIPE
ncbi:MAG: hypothetical protein MJ071_02675 [Oscillospiraceae bacterium]|nr:hypothetical protein [Oscillospiraceae bacterium]